MGRKSKKIELSVSDKVALEKGFKNYPGTPFSRRCHFILLKNKGKTSKEIADIFDITDQVVHLWCTRYRQSGINGLKTKHGQGRKAILNKETDAAIVRIQVEKERQRLSHAKELIEQDLDKSFSMKTLQRFLKALAANGNE